MSLVTENENGMINVSEISHIRTYVCKYVHTFYRFVVKTENDLMITLIELIKIISSSVTSLRSSRNERRTRTVTYVLSTRVFHHCKQICETLYSSTYSLRVILLKSSL